MLKLSRGLVVMAICLTLASAANAAAPSFTITAPNDGDNLSSNVVSYTLTYSGTASSSPAILHQAWGVRDSAGDIVAEGLFTGASFSEMVTLDASSGGSDYTLEVGGVNSDTFDAISIDITLTHNTFLDDAYAVWLFDEGSGTTAEDESPNGVDGTLIGGASWVTGQYGSAIDFDGNNDCVDTGQSTLDNVTEFTIVAWIKTTLSSGSRIGLVGQNNTIEFGLINSSTLEVWSEGKGTSADATWSLSNDEWQHVMAWGTDTEMRLYINNSLGDTDNFGAAGNHGSSTYNVKIGGCGIFDATGNYFTGSIDDVGVFTRALDATERSTIYTYGLSETLGVAAAPRIPNATTTWIAMKSSH